MKDGAQHAIAFLERCVGRKTQHGKALGLEESFPCHVVGLVVNMLRAIELDDELRL
jgi:hypothetical protein